MWENTKVYQYERRHYLNVKVIRMGIDILKTVDVIEIMENYIVKVRPSKGIRMQLDIGYKIEGQSVVLVEVRPVWNNQSKLREYGYAKATFIKSKNVWRIFWMLANQHWECYKALPEVVTLREFLEIVEDDKMHCFKG